MKTYYVIRQGWNAANQSALGATADPLNRFDSRELALVGIAEAPNGAEAIAKVDPICYSNQHLFATANPRAVAGLTAAIRQFSN